MKCSSFSRTGLLLTFLLLARVVSAAVTPSNADTHCRALAQTKLDHATITLAEPVHADPFLPPGWKAPIQHLPPFCRVAATLSPVPDTNIRIELWLPEENWNGRFLGTGNGGGAGKIAYSMLARGLKRGFAVVNTDMGTSPNATAVTGHPARWQNFTDGSTHAMTETGKALVAQYYGHSQQHSYFVGCSTGGGQALMEAQRHPDDYNGIISGAPANNRTHLHAEFLWNMRVMSAEPNARLSPAQIAWVTHAMVAACHGKDGGSPDDNFLTDPRACRFDPATLPLCQNNAAENCLTPVQRRALVKLYSGPVNPRTGERIYGDIPLGSESSGAGLDIQQNPARMTDQLYPFQWVFGLSFQPTQFDFDHDMDHMDATLAPYLNANNPDLRRFQKRGGKLLMFTGTADPLVPYPDTVNYYDRVIAARQGRHTGAKASQKATAATQNFFRYFLVPGMAHCGGGTGLNEFGQMMSLSVPLDREHDLLTALEDWVEQDQAPQTITAVSYKDDEPSHGIRLARPLCPYPQFPTYVSGDRTQASSYRCAAHPLGEVPEPAPRYLR